MRSTARQTCCPSGVWSCDKNARESRNARGRGGVAGKFVAVSKTTRFLSALGLLAREDSPHKRRAIPPRRDAEEVTTGQALGIDGVYRAVSVITTGLRMPTLDATRHGAAIARPALLSRPDPTPGVTRADMIGQTAACLALRGNAYWAIGRDSSGRATSARVLHPDHCTPHLDRTTGKRTVTTSQGTYTHGEDIYHLRLIDVLDDYGLGPIQAYRRGLTVASQMAEYGAQLARPGVPTGTLKSIEHITPIEADQAREEWTKHHEKPGGIAVLGAGIEFQPILLTAAEVQFIESRKLDVASVARIFGIPAHLINIADEGSSLTYQNVRDANNAFVIWGLGNYFSVIESAFTALLPHGQEARFNLDAFLRPSTKERYEAHKIGIEAGFLTTDEVREMENLA